MQSADSFKTKSRGNPQLGKPSGGLVEIFLTKGRKALIDSEDSSRVALYRWYAVEGKYTTYAATYFPGARRVYLHRFLLNAPEDMEVDHRNRDGLDNRRFNLRLSSHAQNCANRIRNVPRKSKYKGVTLDTRNGRWMAKTTHKGKTIFFGRFKTQEEAAVAFDMGILKLHGEFAVTNIL